MALDQTTTRLHFIYINLILHNLLILAVFEEKKTKKNEKIFQKRSKTLFL